uniref:Cadherin domain-containing protein n=1 Tax=Caenorhabditis tropicalis TaxID=1561998 RepID=A0A1I7UXS0_9PELO
MGCQGQWWWMNGEGGGDDKKIIDSKNAAKNSEKGPIYVAEPVQLNEGGSMPLQWKNVYFMPSSQDVNVSHTDIFFTIVESAKHGDIRIDDVVTSSFTYAQLLARRVIYKHDGSESREDRLSFQIEFAVKHKEFAAAESKTYTLRIIINGVNDAPELIKRSKDEKLLIASRGSRVITNEIIVLTDADDRPDKVKVQVVEAIGVHIEVHGQKVNEFSHKQLIEEMVSLVDEGTDLGNGRIRLIARDGESRSGVVILETQSTKVDVKLVHNTGLKLLHHSNSLITNRNLSFEASIKDMIVSYRIVDMPDTGVVECLQENEDKFSMCTSFTQSQVNEEQVRFRHTSQSSSPSDMFSFQVEAGEFASMVHVFRIDFIPMNIKVFTREPFVLNGTEIMSISRQNLFSWTFPKSYSAHNLVYHIDEPPKLGTLSRKLAAGKQRRIGVSSNFTQQDIDETSISYKLHYQQYSIVNDFFVFRVVSPAVSSPLLRFDIVYVPKESSIRLVNKTIVVKEGEIASITSDFLSLSTPDDSNFIFRVVSPTLHGQIRLQIGEVLKKDSNFTSDDISKHRLSYSHSGDETRTDECRLLAISRQNPMRQVPLTLSFSIILLNDNAPKLAQNVTVYMVERGERVLHPFLLPWIDEDVDASALLFDFIQNKDAAILSTVSPYLPLTSFTQHDIDEGKVMIRHLGHHQEFYIGYTVSDGAHRVKGKMHILAAKPDVWIEKSEIVMICGAHFPQTIRLSSNNLTVLTNLDVRLEDIIYTNNSSRFSVGSQRKSAKGFSQKDIENESVWYSVPNENAVEKLKVAVADRILEVELRVRCENSRDSFTYQKHRMLRVPVGGDVLIDKNLLEIAMIDAEPPIIYQVVKHPNFGYLSLDYEKSYSSRVSRFTDRDISSGSVQYVHNNADKSNDSIDFQVQIISRNLSFHLKLDIDVFQRNITISTSLFSVPAGGRAPITSNFLRITTSENEEAVITVVSPPTSGWITTDSHNVTSISSIATFTTRMIENGQVWFVSDGSQGNDSIGVQACVQDQCTGTHLMQITVTRVNEKGPVMIRNEVLRVTGNKALITNSHLDVEDTDTPTNSIIYIIAQPSNGRVVKTGHVEEVINNFTQFDIDQSNVAFLATNRSNPFGGFSFHVTDGKHKIGPEWFSTELSSSSNILEANGRLVASPSSATVIGTELLRANMPGTRPDEIVFNILKPARYGEVLVDGIKNTVFTQLQINRRQVVYSTVGFSDQNEWSRRDSFSFRVHKNNSAQYLNTNEKFRITTTYAALSDKVLSKYVSTRPLIVSRGGSASFNQSHLDVSALADAVDKEATDSLSDSLIFHVYAARESTRRASRIRISVDIQIKNPPDPDVQVILFPDSVSILNSGFTPLLADMLMTRHKTVPPQSIVYSTQQRGANGVSIRKGDDEVDRFSQQEINDGKISLWHTANRHQPAATWHDVIVLDIEGHTRSLIIDIRPLDLMLKNHSTIWYPQGKTYVVLNSEHLGAFSMGNRSSLKYKITSGPENGTFYWVAGEKEAKEFSQQDIDVGRVLYAQLNMHSYQDRFDFVVENDSRDVLRNSSELRVRALVTVQPVIVEADTATPLTTSQINASILNHASPRFFLTSPLRFGKLTFDPNTNYSTYYFTYTDIQKGIVYYKAFSTDEEVHEVVQLEVRADNVQPARFTLPITILRADSETYDSVPPEEQGIPSNGDPNTPKFSIFGENSLPVVILGAIVAATIFVLICRRCGDGKKKNKTRTPINAKLDSPTRLPPSPSESIDHEKPPDLLGTTVFASVRQAEDRMTMKSFNKPPKPESSSSRKPPNPRRQNVSSLDYAGISSDTPPAMRLFEQVAQTQPTNHYWV